MMQLCIYEIEIYSQYSAKKKKVSYKTACVIVFHEKNNKTNTEA